MKVLVLGATGATGSRVVQNVLTNGDEVMALVRNTASIKQQDGLTLIKSTALSMNSPKLTAILKDVDAVISCLGHNLTFKGMFGAPRMLVRDSIQRIVEHIPKDRPNPLKLILMSSSGVRNLDQAEPISLAQHLVLGLLRVMIPPHLDNERAAHFLRTQCSTTGYMQWVCVRPDNLVDADDVTDYQLQPAPIRSAIFDAGQVSRINVSHFMGQLVRDNQLWNKWLGKMPVIYNK